MVYAKQIKNEKIVALYEYGFEPDFGGDETMSVITAEEYAALKAEMEANKPEPPQTDEISDAKALKIILGEETA